QVANLTGSVYVGQTNTVLYVTGSISIGSGGGGEKRYAPPENHIAPRGSPKGYLAGATTGNRGHRVVNDNAPATNIVYLWSAQQHLDQYHRQRCLLRHDLRPTGGFQSQRQRQQFH